jgi:hypothetical protein
MVLMQVRTFICFYFPGVIPSSLAGETIYDGYERQTGVLAIFLVSHMALVWFFLQYFYNAILSKVNQKVRAFNENVKQASYRVSKEQV